ncbi:histidine kinase [Bacillaceae bacterium JMAK1]|nr:histidine kinase [Bacillaceae bacterium JMAK1]
MYRNREFRIFIGWQILVGSVAIGTSLLLPRFSLFIVIALAVVMIVSFIAFTKKRYRHIEQLSTYLKEINAGSYSLDVRDNEEGELSILKNDIYKVTSRLAEYNVDLEEDRKKLTEAISDISHQLKTPITSMTVMADLLQGSELTTERRVAFTKTIQHQLERMDWLVTSLLKLSKIDAGTIEFKREKVPVESIITDALNPLLIPIEVKGITLDIEGLEDGVLSADYNWTKEAVINILKNAVEHTGNGGIVSIQYNENAIYQEIRIRDSGEGISAKDLPYIFKRFYKGLNAGENSVGIGLAMAQNIVTKQHGDIEVTSQEGIGTTFSIKFYKRVV